MTYSILLAGFGGQGILFAGKQLAKSAMYADLKVTWLPSYGPEMRGGAANCSVIISDEEIGSPLIPSPDILIALNIPSHDKFAPTIKAGGLLIADSSLISEKTTRTDIKTAYIPATTIASENGIDGLANVIMLGQFLKNTDIFNYDTFLDDMIKDIPATRQAMIDKNKLALKLGFEY
jgi:Pyruvate:ferredoxin oxidoreductase and related 2-oxoacid:ferredoxin oxidoreductases, gamma subunit